MIRRVGAAGAKQRHFLSRFCSAGLGRRPKYECMGTQDLSHGLYKANVSWSNLEWVGDEAFNAHYHFLEDAWESLRRLLAEGELVHREIDDNSAAWVVSRPGEAIVAALRWDGVDSGVEEVTRRVAIPGRAMRVEVFDFEALERRGETRGSSEVEVRLAPAGRFLAWARW